MNNNNKETRLSSTETNRAERILGHARNAGSGDRLRAISGGARRAVPERIGGSSRRLSPPLAPSSLGGPGSTLPGSFPEPEPHGPEAPRAHKRARRSRQSTLRQAA